MGDEGNICGPPCSRLSETTRLDIRSPRLKRGDCRSILRVVHEKQPPSCGDLPAFPKDGRQRIALVQACNRVVPRETQPLWYRCLLVVKCLVPLPRDVDTIRKVYFQATPTS